MHKNTTVSKHMNKIAVAFFTVFMWAGLFGTLLTLNPTRIYAQQQPSAPAPDVSDTGGTGGQCGGGTDKVNTIIDIGCRGRGNPIADMLFAIIRLLSIGVGIVIIGSLIVAGIQYITSSGEPAAVAKAIERIRSTVLALVLYIFAYALLNWLIPAGLLL